MRDHSPLAITTFQGTYDRGEDETCPVGYFQNSQNIRFIKGGVATQFGSKKGVTIGSVKRTAVYKRIGEATRLIILDSNGKLYDSTNMASPILSIAAMTDFSMVTMFSRAYITPHNGITGLPGEKVYVYEGTGLAIPAAGNGPSSTLIVVESASSGNVEPGLRAYAVAFETVSGFITKPSGFTTCVSTGGFSVDVSNIEIGGARVIARHILATKNIVAFNGNFSDQTYYFVFRIPDNVTTECFLSFYDADLQSDATFLLEQVTDIPAGVGITVYAGKLVVWGENAYPSIGRVSANAQPESFNEVEGFFTVDPGIGGGIKNCWGYRTQLVIQKSQRTYMTQDNGDSAAFWAIGDPIDASIGTECHGVAKSLDFGENVMDRVFTTDRSGVRLFEGTFSGPVLTYSIDDIWSRITQAYFHTIEIVIDPINYQIFIAVPLDGAVSPNALLFCDYIEGLTEETVRWTTWKFPWNPTTVLVDLVNNIPVFKFGSITGNVYELDPTLILDDGQAIDQVFEFPFMPDNDDNINHYTGIKIRAKGAGTPIILVSGLDRAQTLFTQQPTLTPNPGKSYFTGFNFTNERCSVKFQFNTPGDHFILNKFILYSTGVWADRPIG